MESKYTYKSGLVFGKFCCPHKGHLYLINTALKNCEKVTVLICSISSEPIPGEVRFNWLKEIFKREPNPDTRKRINIVHCSEELPQYPDEDKVSFWNLWANVVKRYTPEDLDVLFTSEEYGAPFSRHLGVKHHLVDIDRKMYSVSGTKIRENPFLYWDYIPDIVKPYFIKRIAILGPESVGKSTLTKSLASYFNTNFVTEYGRFVYESNGNKISIDDFIPIAEGRQELEDWLIREAKRVIICDTEDITTDIFAQLYYPEEYFKVFDYFNDKLNKGRKYDLYILLKPDCDPVQDGTRNFIDERQYHYEMIREDLVKRNCNFVEIGGSFDNRFKESKVEVKKVLNII